MAIPPVEANVNCPNEKHTSDHFPLGMIFSFILPNPNGEYSVFVEEDNEESRVIEDDEKKKRKDAVSEIIRNKYYPQLQSHSLYRSHLSRGRDGGVVSPQQGH